MLATDRFACVLQSPIGALTLVAQGDALTHCRFGECIPQGAMLQASPILHEAAAELEAYFRGALRAFTVPLSPEGTAFQRRCWDALRQIPYGETRTYLQQAALIGNPKATRAVGMANHLNPLPIFIPCHRVVGKGGKLTGYAGGLAIKEALLQLEQKG